MNQSNHNQYEDDFSQLTYENAENALDTIRRLQINSPYLLITANDKKNSEDMCTIDDLKSICEKKNIEYQIITKTQIKIHFP